MLDLRAVRLANPNSLTISDHIGGGDNPETPTHPQRHCTDGTNPPNGSLASLGAARGGPLVYSKVPYLHASKSLDGPFERVNITLPPGHVTAGWGNDVSLTTNKHVRCSLA